jgi:hypothetical protein
VDAFHQLLHGRKLPKTGKQATVYAGHPKTGFLPKKGKIPSLAPGSKEVAGMIFP